MKYDTAVHHHRSIRLANYDYTQAGAYFVTIVVYQRACLLGNIQDGVMRPGEYGHIAGEEWFKTAALRPYVRLNPDEWVIMPNHVHGIIWLVEDGAVGERRRRPPTEAFGKPVAGSIPTIVRSFKSATTRRINALHHSPGAPFWQRNYYEHVIRTEAELDRIRRYIQENPLRWEQDAERPSE